MLNVFLTVDTEVWPLLPDWRRDGLARDIARDVYGETPQGRFGVSYQLDLLNRYGLKGVFLVEPLFAEVAGFEWLKALVDEIQAKGHEVQVHLHPEWLGWMDRPLVVGPAPGMLKDFPEELQTALVTRAIRNLNDCGATGLSAFRAGDYAADARTLRSLARNGITFDTSHNAVYLGTRCGLHTPEPVRQPTVIEGVYEFPVSVFSDWPGHYRHAQLCACSFAELRAALRHAVRLGWHSFVIVSHSFEMLLRRRRNPAAPRPDWIVVRRFEKLCRFLADHRDTFRTTGFADLDPATIPAPVPGGQRVPRSAPYNTLARLAGQLVRRVV